LQLAHISEAIPQTIHCDHDDWGCMFLQNTGILLQDNSVTSQETTIWSYCCENLKYQQYYIIKVKEFLLKLMK
jgi:hypothetical protein